MNKTAIKVDFRVIGDTFNPEELTEILQVKPETSSFKGEKYSKGKKEIVRKHSTWILSTGYRISLDVDELVNEIIQKLLNKKEILKEFKSRYKLDYMFDVVIHIEDSQTPSIFINSKIIHFINEIEAEIDIDIYIMS